MNENENKTIKLSKLYDIMCDMYGSDELADYNANEAATIARQFDQDYAIKNRCFHLLGEYDLDVTDMRIIFEYIFKVKMDGGRYKYNFAPLTFGHSMAQVLDILDCDYKLVHINEDELTINIL